MRENRMMERMRGVVLGTLLLIVPQVGLAKVFLCVDPVTGKTSFTDRACDNVTTGEEVRVDRSNLDSGSRYGRAGGRKAWNSQEDARKTGLDYNAERRALYENRATASND